MKKFFFSVIDPERAKRCFFSSELVNSRLWRRRKAKQEQNMPMTVGRGPAGRMFSARGPNDGYSYYIKHKRIEETEKCVRLKNFVLHPSASSEHKGFAFSDAKAIKQR